MFTATAITRLPVKETDYMERDSEHLYIFVRKSGTKSWIFRYKVNGKEKKKTLGTFPAMTLAEARRKRDELVLALEEDNMYDFSSQFKDVAEEWFKRKQSKYGADHQRNVKQKLKDYVYPHIGNVVIGKIKRPTLVKIVTDIFDLGKEETAYRTAGIIENIFKYALDLGLIQISVAQYLANALPVKSAPKQNFAFISKESEITKLLQAMDTIESFQVKAALWLIARTFLRVGSVLKATWDEIDFEKKVWNVPAEHMKTGLDLVVPLSTQMVQLLKEIKEFNEMMGRQSDLIFPCMRPHGKQTSLSESTLLITLKKLCWKVQGTPAMSIHGFRHMASTLLNEAQYPADAIERQLAHVARGVRGVYNKAQYLDIRTEMMQWYSDKLDSLLKKPL